MFFSVVRTPGGGGAASLFLSVQQNGQSVDPPPTPMILKWCPGGDKMKMRGGGGGSNLSIDGIREELGVGRPPVTHFFLILGGDR